MKYNRSVYKCLTLISQFAINIMVPTFMCLLVGLFVSKFLGDWVVIVFLLLGMAAGMRNCYYMAMSATGDTKKKEVSDERKPRNNN